MSWRLSKQPPTAGKDVSPKLPSLDKRGRLGKAFLPATVCLSLAAVTFAVFWPATGFDFVNCDDPAYVRNNPHVQAGFTWEGLAWAFGWTHGQETYWHPLTWISHMLDCQLYGSKPWGHHLTNVLFHSANAALVFLVFRKMTGAFWRCALLAALFALHPLQVGSVAWVSERKNLLSASFWLLTMWAYARYAESGVRGAACGVQKETAFHLPSTVLYPRSAFFYLLSLALFALGLMCKPTLVTLPFVMLLLDYWPLRRLSIRPTFQPSNTPLLRLLLEKLPFLVLGIVSSVVTMRTHQALGSLAATSTLPLDLRLETAVVSYVRYLAKALWPCRLAVIYPYPAAWPMWEVIACGLLLLAISGLVLGLASRRPWFLVGWCWFLGVLVPFSGLVQAGQQAMADRFMYLPSIGLFVVLVWGLERIRNQPQWLKPALASAVVLVLMALALQSRDQLRYWRNSETLFRHALACTFDNYVAHNWLGMTLAKQGKWYDALRQYQLALQARPGFPDAYNNLGLALAEKGQWNAAIENYQLALKSKPDFAEARNNLAVALMSQGSWAEAIKQCELALKSDPNLAQAHCNLGTFLSQRGRWTEALVHYEKAMGIKPGAMEPQNNLAWLLATCPDSQIRDGARAVRVAGEMVRQWNDPDCFDTLAAAYAEAGHFQQAVETAGRALALAAAQTNVHVEEIRARLKLYQAGLPYRQPVPP